MRAFPSVRVLTLIVVLGAGCREGRRGDAPAGKTARLDEHPTRSQSVITAAEAPMRTRCASTLVETPSPDQCAPFPPVADSEPVTAVTEGSVDHYRGGTYEVRLGPFVVRYEVDGRGQCSASEIRQVGCDGPALHPAAYWPGGELRLRRRGDSFVLCYLPAGNAEVPLLAFRRGARTEERPP